MIKPCYICRVLYLQILKMLICFQYYILNYLQYCYHFVLFLPDNNSAVGLSSLPLVFTVML